MTNHVLFYTDSNGLEFEPRVASLNIEVGKRFFPVTSIIINGDERSNKWLSVISDRPFGGSI